MADQLIRETQPPAGMPRSPVPQYHNPDTGKYERVEGADGATKVTVTGTPTVEIEGTPKVEIEGTPEVTVTGTTVEIGGVEFECDPPRTIYGKASERPSASATFAVIPWAYYVAGDTGEVTQTDGSDWIDVL